MITVVIPCAGRGERFGGSLPKQYQELKGIPLFIRTLKVFENHSECEAIVLSVEKEFLHYVEEKIKAFEIKKVYAITEGGKTRQESVYHGVLASPEKTEIFLVHDAVRPFVETALISQLIKEAKTSKAVVPALPVRDALIKVEMGILQNPVSREGLYLVQTPQAIQARILKECLEKAKKENLDFPDESSLLHHFGYEVKIVPGSIFNIKITYPEDFILAERLISK